MAGTVRDFVFTLALVMSLGRGWTRATAEVHHVVGGDRGWDTSSNVGGWSTGKAFRAGDKIWFTYSAALESVVELRNREDYESCNVGNPIRMYTDGIDQVDLDKEGSRYFTSGKPENCKNGLKLHVKVLPQADTENQMGLGSASEKPLSTIHVEATGPTPSISAPLQILSSTMLLYFGFAVPVFMAF